MYPPVFKVFYSSVLVTPVPCSVMPGPDFGFTVLMLYVLLQPDWLLPGIFTLCHLAIRLIYVMISPASNFHDVLDLRL